MKTMERPGKSIKQGQTMRAVTAVAEVCGFDVMDLMRPKRKTRAVTAARDVLALVLRDDVGLALEPVRGLMNYTTTHGVTNARDRTVARMQMDEHLARTLRLVRESMQEG